MIMLPKFDPEEYPTSLWAYLGDMSSYMPTAEDREKLLEYANKRVKIWDYFFRPKPEDIGKPVQEELTKRRIEAAEREAEGQHRLQDGLATLARLEQTHREELAAVEAQLLAIGNDTAARERSAAAKSMAYGATLAGVSAFIGLLLFGAYDTSSGADAIGPGCLLFMWVVVGLPMIFIGGLKFFSGDQRRSAKRVQAVIDAQQQQVRANWASRQLALQEEMKTQRERVAFAREILEHLVPHLRARIAKLERLLQDLWNQCPPIPTVDDVQTFLDADLKEMQQTAKEKLGVEGQTIKDPIVLQGPAEIQDPGSIPPTYLKGDRLKYLIARQFGTTRDGRIARHYGVFYFELLLITKAVLARYSVYFDFIRGESIRERASQQHFADIVMTDMRKEYRKIKINDEDVELEREPSMILSLSSGDQFTVTLPSDEYFAKLKARAFMYDAAQDAESALKIIMQQVKEAKQNLEVGQLAYIKEAERSD